MATVNVTKGGTSLHPAVRGRNLYVIEAVVDWADVLAAKGSALAATDVVQVLNVPAESAVHAAGVEVLTAADSTTLTLDLGIGGDVDKWADGVDGKTAGYGAAGTNGVLNDYARFATADTLDLTLATLTGTLTSGKVRVYAVVADIAGVNE